MPFNIKENFKGKKLNKVSIYFRRISEKETMPGTFFFEDGTSKEGYSYNNNVINGSIEFSNNEDSIPITDFIEGLKDGDWGHVEESFYNFDGEGKSIDYDEDEFENWEHHDTSDCDYDAKKDPSEIYFYFDNKKVTFKNTGNLYVHENISLTKENMLDFVIYLTKC